MNKTERCNLIDAAAANLHNRDYFARGDLTDLAKYLGVSRSTISIWKRVALPVYWAVKLNKIVADYKTPAEDDVVIVVAFNKTPESEPVQEFVPKSDYDALQAQLDEANRKLANIKQMALKQRDEAAQVFSKIQLLGATGYRRAHEMVQASN